MNKNVGILLIALAVIIGAGIYFFTQGKMDGPKGASSLVEQAIQSVQGAPELPSDSVLTNLNRDVVAVFDVSVSGLTPIVDWFNGRRENLARTAAWKRLNLEQQVAVGIEAFNKEFTDKMQAELDQLGPVGLVLQNALQDLKEVTVAMSGKTFTVEQMDIPYVFVSLAFQSPETVKQIYDQLNQLSSQAAGTPLTVEKIGETGFKASVTNPNHPDRSVSAVVNSDGGRMHLVIGSSDEGVMLTSDKSATLISSEGWKSTGAAVLPNSALTFYMNTATFTDVLMGFLKHPSIQTEGVDIANLEEQLRTSWDGLEYAAGSIAFANGVESRQCVKVTPNTNSDTAFKTLLSAQKTASGSHFVDKLVTDHSITVFKFSSALLDTWLTYLKKGQVDLTAAAAAEGPDAQRIADLVNLIVDKAEVMGFKEIGLVINAPTVGMQPNGGILLAGGKKGGQEALEELQSLITQAAGILEAENSLPLTLQQDASGTPVLQTLVGPGMALMAVPVTDNSVLITLDPSYSKTVESLMSGDGESYLSGIGTSPGKVSKVFAAADYAFFFNSKPAIDMVRPFIPLFNQNPAMQLEMSEIEELLTLLETQVLGSQLTYETNGIICTDGSVATVQ